MSVSPQIATDLARGLPYSFANWPNPSVPTFGAGVYTIWHNDGRFIYAGMSGRGLTAETLCRNTHVMLPDGAAAYTLETSIKSGGWEHGRPLLNPGR